MDRFCRNGPETCKSHSGPSKISTRPLESPFRDYHQRQLNFLEYTSGPRCLFLGSGNSNPAWGYDLYIKTCKELRRWQLIQSTSCVERVFSGFSILPVGFVDDTSSATVFHEVPWRNRKQLWTSCTHSLVQEVNMLPLTGIPYFWLCRDLKLAWIFIEKLWASWSTPSTTPLNGIIL